MQTVTIHIPGETGSYEVELQDDFFAALAEQAEREEVPVPDVIFAAVARYLKADRRPAATEPDGDEAQEASQKIARMRDASSKMTALTRLLLEIYVDRAPDNESFNGEIQFRGLAECVLHTEISLRRAVRHAAAALDPREDMTAAMFEMQDARHAAQATGLLRLLGDLRKAKGCGFYFDEMEDPLDVGKDAMDVLMRETIAEFIEALNDVRRLLQGSDKRGAAA